MPHYANGSTKALQANGLARLRIHPFVVLHRYVSAFVGLVVERLLQEDTVPFRNDYMRVICINVVISALFWNPVEVLQSLDAVPTDDAESLTGRIFAMWFSNIQDFNGLHNRKLGIVTLSKLISLTDSGQPLPPSLQQGRS